MVVNTVFLVVVGDSEVLGVRLLSMFGVRRGDRVVFVYSGGEAGEGFRVFASRFLRDVVVEVLEAPKGDFWGVAGWFGSLMVGLSGYRRVVAGLLGGPVLQALAGILISTPLTRGVEVVLVIESGDRLEVVAGSVKPLSLVGALGAVDLEILGSVEEGETVQGLAEKLGLDPSSTGRRVRELVRRGFLDNEGGRPKRFKASEAGRALKTVKGATGRKATHRRTIIEY